MPSIASLDAPLPHLESGQGPHSLELNFEISMGAHVHPMAVTSLTCPAIGAPLA